MSKYLGPQSAVELFRNGAAIGVRHFGSVVLPYVLVIGPVFFLYLWAAREEEVGLLLFSFLLLTTVGVYAYGVIVVSISEICLGSQPNLLRSFKRVSGKTAWQLLATGLMYTLAMYAGFILLIIPGVLVFVWFLLASPIVVLEKRWGWQALMRSKDLTSGYNLRNLGVLLLWSAIGVIVGIIAVVVGEASGDEFAVLIVQMFGQIFLTPLILTSLVLVYYDLRARKEAYDTAGLAEDLDF